MDLAQSTSGLSGRCPEVAVEISPWIWGRSHSRVHLLVFGNVGRGAHVEVVKRSCINILGSGLWKE